MKLSHSGRELLAAAIIASVPLQVLGAEQRGEDANAVQYGLTAGATYTDNAGRTQVNKESETSVELGVTAAIRHDRDRRFANLDASLQFQSHSFGTYGDGVVGGLAAGAGYRLYGDRLVWIVEDNFGQALIRSQDLVTPENTQNLNVFSTGPDITYPLGPRTQVSVQARWSDVAYEASDFGNNRLAGTVGLLRQLGEHSSLSLNGSLQSVRYKDLPSSSDYDIGSVYLTWSAIGARTTLNASAGYSTLDEQADSTSGATYGIELIRTLSSRSTLALYAGRGFGDSGDAMKREQGIRGVSVGDRPIAVSSDPLTSDYATMSWQYSGSRSGLTISGSWRQEKHQRDVTLDVRSLGGRLQLTRRLSPRMALDFHTDYLTEDYSNTPIQYDDWSAGMGLRLSLTPAYAISAVWDHLVGAGDTGLGAGTRDNTENRVTIHLTWSPDR